MVLFNAVLFTRNAFKGHSVERTPVVRGTCSQNAVLYSPCCGNCDEGTPVMCGHSDINVSPEDRWHCPVK